MTVLVLRVLLIEDTPERQDILKSLYRSHAWVLVDVGHRAITLLDAYDFDIISLDYNLRGDITGADIAKQIVQSRNRNARIVVHSLNPRGADEIARILPNAVRYPVSKMVRSNKKFKYLRSAIDTKGVDFDWNEENK